MLPNVFCEVFVYHNGEFEYVFYQRIFLLKTEEALNFSELLLVILRNLSLVVTFKELQLGSDVVTGVSTKSPSGGVDGAVPSTIDGISVDDGGEMMVQSKRLCFITTRDSSLFQTLKTFPTLPA